MLPNIMSKTSVSRLLFLCIGVVLYLVCLIKMTSFGPSAKACLNSSKSYFNGGLFFMLSVTTLMFLGIYLTLLGVSSEPAPLIVCVFVACFTLGLGVYFYMNCFNMNTRLNDRLMDDGSIRFLQSIYEDTMGTVRPISTCVTYHTGEYYKSKDTSCRAIEGCHVSSGIACDPKHGAKLVDFYVASSHNSCHVPITSGNYVSVDMLKTVLIGGARFVDFNVYAQIENGIMVPVVKSVWKNRVSQNYIHIDDIWRTIRAYAFLKKNSDPLLIHLNLHTNNIEVIDKISKSYIDHMNGNNMLDPRYSYHAKKSIALEPICTLLNKAVLIVSGDCSHTHLDELVHLHTSHNARLISAKDTRAPAEPKSFVFSNQKLFTIVIPEPYDNNTNPEDAWSHGCHCFMMNYWNYDKLMENHSEFFKTASFVMKNLNLQEERMEPLKLKDKSSA